MNKTMIGVKEHWNESKEYFNEENMVGIFLHGSQNYGLATESSDIDTKLLLTPRVKSIALNKKPISTTHIRENNEHIEFKDVRLIFDTFRKQNLNFLEILFTEYKIVNPLYEKEWGKLVQAREAIARYNTYAAVKAMQGIAYNKIRLLDVKKAPERQAVIDKFGYDPKQLYQLLRIEEYLEKYIAGASFEESLHSNKANFLKAVKKGYVLESEVKAVSEKAIHHIATLCEPYTADSEFNKRDSEIDALFNEVQENIVRISLYKELNND